MRATAVLLLLLLSALWQMACTPPTPISTGSGADVTLGEFAEESDDYYELGSDAELAPGDEIDEIVEDETLLRKILREHPSLQELDDLYREGGEHYFDGRLDLAEEYFFLLHEKLARGEVAAVDSLALLYISSMERKVESFAAILAEERFFSESYAPLSLSLEETYQSLRTAYGIPSFLLPPTPIENQSQFERELLLVENEKVDQWISYFTGRARENFQTWLERKARVGPIMESILAEEELPAELVYLAMIESGLSAKVRSRAAAVGYWQFVSGTARNRGLRVDDWIDERRDIEQATRAAARHLKMMYGMFGQWPLALAAYNAGEYRIQRAIGLQGDPDYWDLRLPRETREYVPKFIAAARIGSAPESYGFTLGEIDTLRFAHVELDDAYSLEQLSEASGVPKREFDELNPQLLAGCTPPNTTQYFLRVPVEHVETIATAARSIPEAERLNWRKHKVQRGETLGQLARRYRTSVSAIMSLNGIRDPRKVRSGRVLTVPYPRGYEPPAARTASSTATTPEPPRSGQKEIRVRVESGDTLEAIAKRYSVSVVSLRRANGLSGSRIYAGQELMIHVDQSFAATDGPEVSESTHLRTDYKVRSGDTLVAIGKRHGVNVGDLLRWNNLPRSGRIHPGDVLHIWKPRSGG